MHLVTSPRTFGGSTSLISLISVSPIKSKDRIIDKFGYLCVYTDIFLNLMNSCCWILDLLLRTKQPRLTKLVSQVKSKIIQPSCMEKLLTFHKGLDITWYQNPVTMFGVIFVICKEASPGEPGGLGYPVTICFYTQQMCLCPCLDSVACT